jgi:hypothetical protein
MKCSESFGVVELWVFCNNPASVIATEYKHGGERAICAHCLLKLDKEDKSNFFQRHEFRGID